MHVWDVKYENGEIRDPSMMHGIATTLLFSSFRHVLNVICSFLGNSPASEF